MSLASEESVAELATRAARNVTDVLSGRRVPDTVSPLVYEGATMLTLLEWGGGHRRAA